ncbi:MAG: DNA translocase FtsK [Clostridia bacterium]|nr:DNA translocase FtsK [Clostridia bacterium]
MKNINVPIGIMKNNKLFMCAINKAPHILILGKTGSGKSVLTNDIIRYLIDNYLQTSVKISLINCKATDFSEFSSHVKINHYYNTLSSFLSLVSEMNKRYDLFSQHGVVNIDKFNESTNAKLDRIIVVIDEIGAVDCKHENKIQSLLSELVRKGHGAGIHIIIATQRIFPNVITPEISANIPTRIAFKLSNSVDSSFAIYEKGAEKLQKGELLYIDLNENKPIKLKINTPLKRR